MDERGGGRRDRAYANPPELSSSGWGVISDSFVTTRTVAVQIPCRMFATARELQTSSGSANKEITQFEIPKPNLFE